MMRRTNQSPISNISKTITWVILFSVVVATLIACYVASILLSAHYSSKIRIYLFSEVFLVICEIFLWIGLLFFAGLAVIGYSELFNRMRGENGRSEMEPSAWIIVITAAIQTTVFFIVRAVWAPYLSVLTPCVGLGAEFLGAQAFLRIVSRFFSAIERRIEKEDSTKTEQLLVEESEESRIGRAAVDTLPRFRALGVLRHWIHPAVLLMIAGAFTAPVSRTGVMVAAAGILWWTTLHVRMVFHFLHASPRRRGCWQALATAQVASICYFYVLGKSLLGSVAVVTAVVIVGPLLYRPWWCRSLFRILGTAAAAVGVTWLALGWSGDARTISLAHKAFRLVAVAGGLGTAVFFAFLFLAKTMRDFLRNVAPGGRSHARWLPLSYRDPNEVMYVRGAAALLEVRGATAAQHHELKSVRPHAPLGLGRWMQERVALWIAARYINPMRAKELLPRWTYSHQADAWLHDFVDIDCGSTSYAPGSQIEAAAYLERAQVRQRHGDLAAAEIDIRLALADLRDMPEVALEALELHAARDLVWLCLSRGAVEEAGRLIEEQLSRVVDPDCRLEILELRARFERLLGREDVARNAFREVYAALLARVSALDRAGLFHMGLLMNYAFRVSSEAMQRDLDFDSLETSEERLVYPKLILNVFGADWRNRIVGTVAALAELEHGSQRFAHALDLLAVSGDAKAIAFCARHQLLTWSRASDDHTIIRALAPEVSYSCPVEASSPDLDRIIDKRRHEGWYKRLYQRGPRQIAECEGILAMSAARLGLKDLACDAVLQCVKAAESSGAPETLLEAYQVLAHIAVTDGLSEIALQAYTQAIDADETLRRSVRDPAWKIALAARTQANYDAAIWLAIELGQPEQAFEFTERARSRSLLDAVMEPRQDESTERLRYREFQRLYEEARLESSGELYGVEVDGVILGAKMNKISHELVAERRYLEIVDPEFTALGTAAAVRLETVRARLDETEAIVSYFATSRGMLVFCVSAETVTCGHVVGFETNEAVAEIRRAVTKPALQGPMGVSHRVRDQLLGGAYLALLGPIEGALVGKTCITIVPHGALHHLPFAALWDQARGEHLGALVDISISPSASIEWVCRSKVWSKSRGGPSVILAATDVPGMPRLEWGMRECQAIARMVDSRVYFEAAATKDRFETDGRDASLLHIICHGEFKTGDPGAASLRLAPTAIDSGVLGIADLRRLRFPNAQLVVLSACNTGGIDMQAGDEMLGLVQAFLEADVPSMMVTLWPVDDAITSELMIAFYLELQTVTSPARALRAAQAALRTSNHPAPYYWAPFIIIGAGHEVRLMTRS